MRSWRLCEAISCTSRASALGTEGLAGVSSLAEFQAWATPTSAASDARKRPCDCQGCAILHSCYLASSSTPLANASCHHAEGLFAGDLNDALDHEAHVQQLKDPSADAFSHALPQATRVTREPAANGVCSAKPQCARAARLGTRRCLAACCGARAWEGHPSTNGTLASGGVGSGGRSACSRVVSGQPCLSSVFGRKVTAKLSGQRSTRLEQLCTAPSRVRGMLRTSDTPGLWNGRS